MFLIFRNPNNPGRAGKEDLASVESHNYWPARAGEIKSRLGAFFLESLLSCW
jgi:hypothetical protein